MRILYVACGFDGGKSGISVYMRETLKRLALRHQVTVLVTAHDRQFLPDDPLLAYHVLPRFFNPAALNMLYVWLLLGLSFRKRDFDLLLLAAANRRATATRKWRTLAVVHDLSQYHVDGKYDLLRTIYIKYLLPKLVRHSSVVVTACQTSREDLIRCWHIPPERIRIDYLGFNRDLFRSDLPPETIARVRQKYRLERPFIFYVSRIEHPGKNHLRLIRAYEQLPAAVRDQYDLVLGGARWSRSEEVFDYWENSPVREHIRFIGFVEIDDLPALYRLCAMYVFPSLFEGFGLSLLEAMACGAPVACSNNSSLGEVAGDAAEQFNPEDCDAIREAVARVLTDENRRRQLMDAGFRRIGIFSWDAYCDKLTIYAQPTVRQRVLGVEYCNVTVDAALELIARALALHERRKVAFVNAHCFNVAWNRPDYRAALRQFDYVFPDGSGVRLAGKLLDDPVIDNVNGTDLLPRLLRLATAGGYSVFLLGAKPGVAEKMRRNLERDYPGLKIVGVRDGYGSAMEMTAAVNRAEPDILLTALGVPGQELFLAGHFGEMRCKVALGVGGLFDFFSGNIPRAPHWMRKLGLEWGFRLWQEPRRMFRRYVIGNPLFVYRVWRYGRMGRL